MSLPMPVTLARALQSLRPNMRWSILGDTYEGLQWHEDNVDKPTEEEVMAEYQRLVTAEPMRLLRIERDIRLAKADWVVIRAYSRKEDVPEEWSAYMQALRDLPNTTTPTLLPNGALDMTSIQWPTPPQ